MAVLDRELTDIETGANDRLIVQMPPRHGKSYLTSCFFPAHYLGMHPSRNVILTSATNSLAMEFSAMARDTVAEHGWMFGINLRKDRSAVERWQLEQGGGLRAAGVGGDVMGRGADLLIVDDYFKDIEEALSETMRTKLYQWFLSTSQTRLSPSGAIVLMATRWHGKDLIGEVLRTAEETGEKWRIVKFPALGDDGAALWPEQWSAEKLESRKRSYTASGYPWMWEALYQQNPPDVLDSEWPREYFENIYTDYWPPKNKRHLLVVALDPSLGKTDKADYSAFVAVAKGRDGNYYVDANISRRPSSQIVAEGVDWMADLAPDHFGCETNQFQELLREQFEAALPRAKMTLTQVWGINNSVPKLTRIRSLTSSLAKGRIKIRRSPGSSLLVEQLKGFPAHKFFDGPDALEMAIRLTEELLQGTAASEPVEERVYA
jgi:predicted phage terminase large subunit-like protein